MNTRLREIPRLLRTPLGRKRLRDSLVARTRPILFPLARGYRRTLLRRTHVVAVVGSFGKTTTRRAVMATLGLKDDQRIRNAGVAVARALLRIPPWRRYGVVEIGVDRPGQMAEYARLLRPDVVVVTTIGSEHLSSMKTLAVTRWEKAEMVRALCPSGLAVLNGDDANVLWMRGETSARAVTYGFGEANDVRAREARLDWPHGVAFHLCVGTSTIQARSQLVGRHSIYSLLAAAAVADAEGVPVSTICASLERLPPTRNRLEPIVHPSGAIVLLDAFKSALETVHAALDALDEIPARRKIAVLGDVEEPPGSQGPIYRALGRRAAEICDRVIFVGPRQSYQRLAVGLEAGGMSRKDVPHVRRGVLGAVAALDRELCPGNVILIKGRCTQHLERIALAMSGRDVGCDVRFCRLRGYCGECRGMRRGWAFVD